MDYKKHYDLLIESRRNLIRSKVKGQCDFSYEYHHIKPKCLGGTDSSDNIVLLTPREHYIAHWLLWKATRNTKLAFAFISMAFTNKDKRRLTSVQYERARQTQRNIISEFNTGRKRTPEQIERVAKAHRGKKRSEETKQKLKDAWVIRRLTPVTEETKSKLSESIKAAWQNEELREAARQRKIEYNKIFNTTEFICPHCGKVGKGPNMKRYHFDKCKILKGSRDGN